MGDRERIVLACSQCDARNYKTTKRRGAAPGQRIEMKKHCPTCNAHTLHRETK